MKENQPKILLIEPPFYRLFKDTYSLETYPLSLGYLAGVVKELGFKNGLKKGIKVFLSK